MYESILLVHSWTRWAVFLSVLYFLFRCARGWRQGLSWTASDNHFLWAFTQVFFYQVGFGLFLWMALSPLTKSGFRNPALITENGVITFWILRHPLTMLLALGVFQIGRARAKKIAPAERHRLYTITLALVLLLLCSAIPWPWLEYGRPLLRLF